MPIDIEKYRQEGAQAMKLMKEFLESRKGNNLAKKMYEFKEGKDDNFVG